MILRLRSFLASTRDEFADRRVVIVAHQVTVNCLRYLIEELDEARLLAIDRLGDVPNCAVTSYECHPDSDTPKLALQNFVAPLQEAGTPVTSAPDAPSASKA